MALLSAFNRNWSSNNMNQMDLYYHDVSGAAERIYLDKILGKYVYYKTGRQDFYNDIDLLSNKFPLTGWRDTSNNLIDLTTDISEPNWKIIKGNFFKNVDEQISSSYSYGFNQNWNANAVDYIDVGLEAKTLPLKFSSTSGIKRMYAGINNYKLKDNNYENYNFAFVLNNGALAFSGSQYITNIPQNYLNDISGNDIKDIAIGKNHIIVLKKNGEIKFWGDNSRNQINFDVTTGIKSISAHYDTSLILDSGGTARFYGNNIYNNPPSLVQNVNAIHTDLFNCIYITDSGVQVKGKINQNIYEGNFYSGKKIHKVFHTSITGTNKEDINNVYLVLDNYRRASFIYSGQVGETKWNVMGSLLQSNNLIINSAINQFTREIMSASDSEYEGSIYPYVPPGKYTLRTINAESSWQHANPSPKSFILEESNSLTGYTRHLIGQDAFLKLSGNYGAYGQAEKIFFLTDRYRYQYTSSDREGDPRRGDSDMDRWLDAWEKIAGSSTYDNESYPYSIPEFTNYFDLALDNIHSNFEIQEARLSGTIYPVLTAISPRWALGNVHFSIGVNQTVNFGDNIYRTVTHTFPISPNGQNTDALLYRLDQDVPSGKIYPLPDPYQNITGAKVIFGDQEDKEVTGYLLQERFQGLGTIYAKPYIAEVLTPIEWIYPGDSSNPAFVFKNNQPALLTSWWGRGSVITGSLPTGWAPYFNNSQVGFGPNYHHKDIQDLISGKIVEFGDIMFDVL